MNVLIDATTEKNRKLSAIVLYIAEDNPDLNIITVISRTESYDIDVGEYENSKALIEALKLDYIPIIDEDEIEHLMLWFNSDENNCVVEALRNGDRDKGAYLVGVFSSLAKAQSAGLIEEHYRGGKYTAHIEYLSLNCLSTDAMDYMRNDVDEERANEILALFKKD